MYAPIDRFSLIRSGPPGILDFSSLAAILSFTYSEPCYLTVIYVIIFFVFVTKYVIYSIQKPFGPIYRHSGSYSFAAPILRTRECPTMFSHAQTSPSHKSKNPRWHDEDSSGITLTPCNQSKLQFLNTLAAPARQSRKPPSSSDRDKHEVPTLQRTLIKPSVQPERKTDNEYKNEADDDFRPSF